MALSPPSSPTVGQAFVASGRTWCWTGSAWELTTSTIGSTAFEFATTTSFPATGATGIVYTATDTGKIYRWTGTFYIELGTGVATIGWNPAIRDIVLGN
jgi:hypothetical protein